MTKFVRDSPCRNCGQPLIWDDAEKTLSCGCGKCKANFVNMQVFKPLKEPEK